LSAENSLKLTCPSATCQAENDFNAEVCRRCGLPLLAFGRLSVYPAVLFNMGLSKAQENQMAYARDLFAAVVYWCPKDVEARNALAMACFALGDHRMARSHWASVLKQSPVDSVALRGLAAIESAEKARAVASVGQHFMVKTKQHDRFKKRHHRRKR